MITFIKKYWHLIFLGLLCLTPFLWFLGKNQGVIIDGLDTNFPLDPLVWFQRRFFIWSDVVNAGSDFSSSASGLFFHLIQVIPYLLGFSLRGVQLVSLVFWFSAIIFSSYTLARLIVPKSKLAQIVMVVIYSYNIYLFNTWENIKVANLSLVASLPLFVAILYSLTQKIIKFRSALVYICLVSVLAYGSGINPAYFATIIFTIAVTVLILAIDGIGKRDFFKILTWGVYVIGVLVLVNLFWILPLLNNLIAQSTRSLADIGLTNWLDSLSENTSLLNVIRLQGAWDWYTVNKYGVPEYLPYALNYLSRLPFIVFSFVVPFLSFASLVFMEKRKRFWYLLFGTFAVVGIFLGAGSHPPTGGLFMFFATHVPFFSFFRSPWYIFTPVLIIAYSGLVALLISKLSELLKGKYARFVLPAGVFLFLIFYFLYNYPLVTGKIFRPQRNDSFYVKFPEYVWQTKDWLAKNVKEQSRLISYPDDQLEVFTWGYRGTESIINLFSNKEVITPSFNIQSKTFAALLDQFFVHMRRQEFASAFSIMKYLGADTIFVKKDISTIFPGVSSAINQLVETTTFGKWEFMKPKNFIAEKIFLPQHLFVNLSQEQDLVYAVPVLPDESVFVNNSSDTEVAKIIKKEEIPLYLRADNILPKAAQVTDIARNERGEEFNVGNIQEYGFSLPKHGSFNIAIERSFLKANNLKVKLDSLTIAENYIKDGDSFVMVGPINISAGKHIVRVEYPLAENILVLPDLNNYAFDSGLREGELLVDAGKTLVVFNPANTPKEIAFSVKNPNPFIKYIVGFDYKYSYGSIPRIDLVQSIPTSPVKSFPMYLGSSVDWEKLNYVFEPVHAENSKLEFIIKMPANKPGDRSKAYLENLFVRRIYDNKVLIVENDSDLNPENALKAVFTKISPVKYEVEVENVSSDKGYIIAFLENYNRDWSLTAYQAKGDPKPIHFKINGYANGWYIPAENKATKFVIYYQPQKLYLISWIVSVGTFFLILILNFCKRNKS
jgi:hypothetical protein